MTIYNWSVNKSDPRLLTSEDLEPGELYYTFLQGPVVDNIYFLWDIPSKNYIEGPCRPLVFVSRVVYKVIDWPYRFGAVSGSYILKFFRENFMMHSEETYEFYFEPKSDIPRRTRRMMMISFEDGIE